MRLELEEQEVFKLAVAQLLIKKKKLAVAQLRGVEVGEYLVCTREFSGGHESPNKKVFLFELLHIKEHWKAVGIL